MRRETGSAHTFMVIGLVVALLGALSFIFWQNFIKSEPSPKTQTTNNQSSPVKESLPEEADPNDGYVVLEKWGVRFKKSDQVTVYEFNEADDGNPEHDSYALSTKRVSELNGCSDVRNSSLISISRHKDYIDPKTYASTFALNNNEPIGGYYYTGSGGGAFCSTEDQDIQGQDARQLAEMAKDLEKAK